jgi:predicted phage terminase large subunit-like protein
MSNKDRFNAVLRSHFPSFLRKAFHTIFEDTEYQHNWHLDAIAHQLMRVTAGEITRLLINVYPRSLKSMIVSVAYPAWCLGNRPSQTIIVVSYSGELATDLHRPFRTLLDAGWYRDTFPEMKVMRDTGSELVTTKGGSRYAASVLGTLTGRGADLIIIDDPLKAEDANSEIARKQVNDWYPRTLISRLNDKKKSAIVVVMQRLHEYDLTGYLLSQDQYYHLNLPAIATEKTIIPLGNGKEMIREVGSVLHPDREDQVTLDRLKASMGSLQFAAQYQQQPVPPGGNLLKREWIKTYRVAPDRTNKTVVQSWDIASTINSTGDWSACVTLLIDKRNYYILDVWRGRLEFPELKRKLIGLARDHQPTAILIEHAGAGLPLIQECKTNPATGVPLPIGIKPQGDKITRMAAQCVRFEAGQVYLPTEAPWLSDFLHELLAFPYGRHDDQVDALAQALKWAEARQSNPFVMIGCGGKLFVGGVEIISSV